MALSAEVAKKRTHLNVVELADRQFVPEWPVLGHVLAVALVAGVVLGGGVMVVHNGFSRTAGRMFLALARFCDRSLVLPAPAVAVDEATGEETDPRRLQAERRARAAWRWVARPLIAVLMLAVLGGVVLDTMLRLEYPDEHKAWRADPVEYVLDYARSGIGSIWLEA